MAVSCRSSLLPLVADSFPAARILLAIRHELLITSSTLQIALLIRILANPFAFLRELRSVRTISAHTALFIALQLRAGLLPATYPSSPAVKQAAIAVVHGAALINAALTLRFSAICAARRAAPEPYWFPAVVSLASLSLAGGEVGTSHWLLMASLAVGALTCAILVPCTRATTNLFELVVSMCCEPHDGWTSTRWDPSGPLLLTLCIAIALCDTGCAWRVLSAPECVAVNPTVVLLMAPAAFISLCCFKVIDDPGAPSLNAGLPSLNPGAAFVEDSMIACL